MLGVEAGDACKVHFWSAIKPIIVSIEAGNVSLESSQVKFTELYSEITVIRNVMRPEMSLTRLGIYLNRMLRFALLPVKV